MPYITQTARRMIADGGPVTTAGELNYVITKELLGDAEFPYGKILGLIHSYMQYKGLSYGVANDIVGALECARREFKRRKGLDSTFLTAIADKFYGEVVAPYEDQKIQQNGDVF